MKNLSVQYACFWQSKTWGIRLRCDVCESWCLFLRWGYLAELGPCGGALVGLGNNRCTLYVFISGGQHTHTLTHWQHCPYRERVFVRKRESVLCGSAYQSTCICLADRRSRIIKLPSDDFNASLSFTCTMIHCDTLVCVLRSAVGTLRSSVIFINMRVILFFKRPAIFLRMSGKLLSDASLFFFWV